MEKGKRRVVLLESILGGAFLAYIFAVALGLLPEAAKQIIPFLQNGRSASQEAKDNLNSFYSMELLNNTINRTSYKGKFLADESLYIELNGLCAKLMGQQFLNKTVKLNNGYLASVIEQMPEESIASSANAVKAAADALDCSYLYVQTPHTISKYDKQVPKGIVEYSNENMDIMLQYLDQLGVPYLDIREEMYQNGINQYDYCYRTDHHWTVEGGFFAYNVIMDYMAERWKDISFDVDAREWSNYSIDIFPEWHLGSNGQRVGEYYAGVDDFQLVRPLFETQITNYDAGLEGDFDEVLLSFAALEKRDLKSRSTYDITYGSKVNGHFINHSEDVIDLKVMIISDSMGAVVKPFLALSFREVLATTIASPLQLAEEFQPDIVIDLRYPGSITKLI